MIFQIWVDGFDISQLRALLYHIHTYTVSSELESVVGKDKMCFGGLHLFLKIVNRKLKTENTFWLFQHGVRDAYFQSYSHLN